MKISSPIEGNRIFIRNYDVYDKDFVCKMWFDEENGKYLSDPTELYIDDVYRQAIDNLQDSKEGYYFVVEDKISGENIGSCCAFFTDDGSSCDIGYCVAKKYWKKGYGTEIVTFLGNWIFSTGAKKITAEVAKDNIGSNRLLEKMGYSIEKETSYKKYHMDISFDSYVYAKIYTS